MIKRATKQDEKSASNRNAGAKGENSNPGSDLQELFLDELADVHSAEQQLVKALPKMAKSADSDELREAFEAHLEETREHVSRLEEVVSTIGESLKSKTCAAMQGLVKEGNEIIEEQEGTTAMDAGLIAAAQKVEHYEIASYGTLIAWAQQLGHREAAQLHKQTLDEEKAADEKLTSVAESLANEKAGAE
jgi:ferritin-like metal-binding protein YciE